MWSEWNTLEPGASTGENSWQAAACTSWRNARSAGNPYQPSRTVTLRPSASVKPAMSRALPKACSEIGAPVCPFMGRHEYADICLISMTGCPTQRIAAGWIPLETQLSSEEMSGQARVAGGLSAAGPGGAGGAVGSPNGSGGPGGDNAAGAGTDWP